MFQPKLIHLVRAVNLQDDLKIGMRLGRVDMERQLEEAFYEYA